MKTRDVLPLVIAFLAVPVLLLGARRSHLVSAQDTPTVAVRDAGALGAILVDARGFTLYVFDRDTAGVRACLDACTQTWPPLLIESGDPVAPPDLPGTLSVVERADGARQVTYNDRPLYTYSGAAAASPSPSASPGPTPAPPPRPSASPSPAPAGTIRTVPADTPPGTVLLTDDFSDPTRPTLPVDSRGNNGTFGYAGGEYVARGYRGTAGSGVLIRLPLRARNTMMTVDARVIEDPRGREIELTCRIQSTPLLNGYSALVEPGQQTVTIMRLENGILRVLDAPRVVPAMRSDLASNRLSLSCVGDTITVEVNDAAVASVRDTTWESGQLGLGVGVRFSMAIAEVRFDNLVIVQR